MNVSSSESLDLTLLGILMQRIAAHNALRSGNACRLSPTTDRLPPAQCVPLEAAPKLWSNRIAVRQLHHLVAEHDEWVERIDVYVPRDRVAHLSRIRCDGQFDGARRAGR